MKGPVAIVKEGEGYGFLGIQYSDGPPPLSIQSVVPRSGADRAGVKVGDKIVALGDVRMPDAAAIQQFVRRSSAGTEVPLELDRLGTTVKLRVRLMSVEELHERVKGRGYDGKE